MYLYCVLLKWGVFWLPLVTMVMCGWLPGHCRAWYPSFNDPFTVTSLTAGRAFSAWIQSMHIVCSPLCKPSSALWWDSMGGFCVQGMWSRGKWGSFSRVCWKEVQPSPLWPLYLRLRKSYLCESSCIKTHWWPLVSLSRRILHLTKGSGKISLNSFLMYFQLDLILKDPTCSHSFPWS